MRSDANIFYLFYAIRQGKPVHRSLQKQEKKKILTPKTVSVQTGLVQAKWQSIVLL